MVGPVPDHRPPFLVSLFSTNILNLDILYLKLFFSIFFITAEVSKVQSELEQKEVRIDELVRSNEELSTKLSAQQKVVEQQKASIQKCIDVVKRLLIEKSTIEKKEARARCMQNRLRLGQFVTQRVGATFQENWTDGYAFQELAKRQEELGTLREEIDRQRKLLGKRKPSAETPTGTTRKRVAANTGSNSGSNSQPSNSTSTSAVLNGTETLKGDMNREFNIQEYYEAEEILKVLINLIITSRNANFIYFLNFCS